MHGLASIQAINAAYHNRKLELKPRRFGKTHFLFHDSYVLWISEHPSLEKDPVLRLSLVRDDAGGQVFECALYPGEIAVMGFPIEAPAIASSRRTRAGVDMLAEILGIPPLGDELDAVFGKEGTNASA